MAGLVYLSLKGSRQGMISAGCMMQDSVGNKAQISHQDQILVYALSHGLTREHNVNHHEVTIIKPIDKSSPLLAKAISENENLECCLDFYRTSKGGGMECFYKVILINARISDLELRVPHNLHEAGKEIQEKVSFTYGSISWTHCHAGTSAYSLWEDRVL